MGVVSEFLASLDTVVLLGHLRAPATLWRLCCSLSTIAGSFMNMNTDMSHQLPT